VTPPREKIDRLHRVLSKLLMGQALEYEIANVVDPSFTVVAKVQKALLVRR
jgi:hypothetical protein